MYQMAIEYTVWSQNMYVGRPNGKKYQHLKNFQNSPKLGFLGFENIPSGNTGAEAAVLGGRHHKKTWSMIEHFTAFMMAA
jgi:hypothetical protein